MKIIIIYASAGSGHFKAARAIYDYFKEADPSLDLNLVDALDYASQFYRRNYIFWYTLMIERCLWLWALSFHISNCPLLQPLVKAIHFILNRLNTAGLEEFLVRENPDFIISTHFLPPEVVSYLRRKKRISSRLVTVITDFGVHRLWLSEASDIYAVASDFTKEKLLRQGIREDRIKVFGIPIEPKFLKGFSRQDLCAKLNIDERKFTVLIIAGSFGVGPIEQIADLLHGQVQVLAVCARNESLFNRLEAKGYADARVFGFVDNIEELMAVSDLIITKPGGLSIAELLAVELVPIFMHAIPGQEVTNIKALAGYGIGIRAESLREIKEAVLNYKDHPEKLNQIKNRIRQIKRPFAARELYNALCQGSSRPSR